MPLFKREDQPAYRTGLLSSRFAMKIHAGFAARNGLIANPCLSLLAQ
jgi:hypothetical protein